MGGGRSRGGVGVKMNDTVRHSDVCTLSMNFK